MGVRNRMSDTLEFMEMLSTVYQEVKQLPDAGFMTWLKTGLKARKLLG